MNLMTDFDFEELRSKSKVAIYLLSDPRADNINCYVGQTNNKRRFNDHMARTKQQQSNDTSAAPKKEWISELRELNIEFNVDVLEVCDSEDANFREWYWIGSFEESPFHILTNSILDRAIGAAISQRPCETPSQRRKKGWVAMVSTLNEIYAHVVGQKIGPHSFLEGYRLLGEKHQVKDNISDHVLHELSGDYWNQLLGAGNLRLFIEGKIGGYVAEEMQRDPNCTLKIVFTDYIPWHLKKAGFSSPSALRADLRTRLFNMRRLTETPLVFSPQGESTHL